MKSKNKKTAAYNRGFQLGYSGQEFPEKRSFPNKDYEKKMREGFNDEAEYRKKL